MKEYFNGFSTQDLVDMRRNDEKRKEKVEMEKEIERLNNIINEISKDLQQVVIWCAENKHNENTIERYLVVDYGTIVRKINEIRTKLDKENNNDTK